ncbi:MAG TPA: nitroreductase [Nitrospiraceae bacterium]|nr:nitroreductase [Nitrospiraceae bacterium]
MNDRSQYPGSKTDGIGDRFQQETKYDPERMDYQGLDWSRRPEPYKDYPSSLARIALPEPDLSSAPSLWNVFANRRSRRSYDAKKLLPISTLSTLLWAAQGISAQQGEFLFRTAPSAGALYPIETYLSVRSVDDLEPGIYHFRPQAFDLELLNKGDYSTELAGAALGQAMVAKAQVTFIWSAMVERSKWKYRQRAYRYIYLDAGHIAENLYLAAEALGLGVCAIGALFDDQANRLIGIDGGEETAIYMASVGLLKNHPRR